MIFRQAALTLCMVSSNIALARILSPSDFGLYVVIAGIVAFFNMVGDVGLGAALIQQADEPSERQLRSAFTAQQVIALITVLTIMLASPFIAQLYHLAVSSIWLMRAVSLSLLCASLRSLPGMMLERSMQFGKIAVIDSVQTFGYTFLAVMLALLGFKVWSLAIASLASSIIGLLLAYRFMPWRPALTFHWVDIRHLVSFGIGFQGAGIVGMVKDSINPLLIGSLAGLTAVGYVNWANQLATYPVIAVWIINKVTFPLFSRVKDDASSFRENLEMFIRASTMISYGLLTPIVALAPSMTPLIFGEKWLPGVPMVYLCAVAVIWVGPGLPVGNALSAIGCSGTMLRFSILWALLTWVLGIPFVVKFGFMGYGFANVVVLCTNVLVLRKLGKFHPFDCWSNVSIPLGGLIIAGGTGFIAAQLYPTTSIISMVLIGLLTVLFYVFIMRLFWWRVIAKDIRTIRCAFIT